MRSFLDRLVLAFRARRRGRALSAWEQYSARLAEAAAKAEPASTVEELIELRRSATFLSRAAAEQGQANPDRPADAIDDAW